MTEAPALRAAEETLDAVRTGRYAAYPAYKPSGVEWLEGVPEHWDVPPLYSRYDAVLGKMLDEKRVAGEALVPYLRNVDIQWDRVNTNDLPEMDIATSDYERFTVREGDLLVCEGGEVGRCAIWQGQLSPCGFQKAIHRLRAQSARDVPRFLFYVLRCAASYGAFVAGSNPNTIPHLTGEKLRRHRFPMPPFEEQRAIARFLDEETRKIDDLIEAKRRLLDLLKEKRQAVITYAVTRGLDPAAKLKPSGVQWLGDVPEHWDVKSLKWDSAVLRGASPRPIDDPVYFDNDGEYAWVRISDVTAAGTYLYKTKQRLSKFGASLSVKLEPGDVFLSIAGSVGKPCITKTKCCIHDGFVYFPRLSCDRKFLYYIFASGEPYKGLGKLGTQLNLNTDTIGSINMAFPPPEEQRAIVRFLDEEMRKMDTLDAVVQEAIASLESLRASIISAAVTGKIDVRGETA